MVFRWKHLDLVVAPGRTRRLMMMMMVVFVLVDLVKRDPDQGWESTQCGQFGLSPELLAYFAFYDRLFAIERRLFGIEIDFSLSN